MAERGDERSGLFAKSQAKYGTTSKLTVSNESFLKHLVSENDTLQGIALKYGVPVQELRRANNSWTNDSLFLREYILVPLGTSPMQSKKNLALNGDVRPKENVQEIVTRRDLNELAKTHSMTSSCAKSDERVQENALSAKDFLSKFDNSLAKIKDNIQKLEDKSQFPEDHHNPLNLLPTKKETKFYSLHNRRSIDLSDDSDCSREPELAFKSTRHSRKVRNSLEKLEQDQDDIFQL